MLVSKLHKMKIVKAVTLVLTIFLFFLLVF